MPVNAGDVHFVRTLDVQPASVDALALAVDHVVGGSDVAMPPGRRIPGLDRLTIHFGKRLDPGRLADEAQGDNAASRIVDRPARSHA